VPYGRRIPLEFRQRDGARDPYFPGDTLAMRPVNGFPLADDHTYCGLLTRRLKDRSGLPLQRDAAFGRALAEEASLAPLRSWLHGQPLAGEVVVATCFRTQDATAELQRIEEFLSHHPTGALYGVETGRSNPAFHEILARYRAPNFQSGTAPYVTSGGDVVFGPDGRPVVQRQEELRVRLIVPRDLAMPAKGWPVVLYSHGTGGDWASCLDILGDVVGRGLAMICIDQPFHGARGTGIDPAAVTFNLFNPAAARTNFRQGALDTSFLARMVADGRFDLAAGDAGVPSAARLDPGAVVQFGHSQGAITGTIALGADPRLDAAVLSAPAGVFGDVGFLQRPDQEILRFVLSIILGMPQDHVDAFHPVATLFQTVWDAADPVNYSPYWVGRDVLLTAGTEDPFSLVAAANAVAAAGGVPILQPLATPSAAHDLRGLTPVPLPVRDNLPGLGGERVTGGLHQRLGGDHFIAFSDKDTRALWRTFVHSLATTDPPVIGAGDQPPPGNPPPPPAHDSFSAAMPIDAMPFSTIAATRSASAEEGEPRPCGEVGATVWYEVTARDDVHVDLDTFGSDFDTVLAVYAGDTIGDLAPIACSDDATGRLSSRVIFEASAETTYRVQVGGFGGEYGRLVLSGQTFSLPPPPPPPPPPTALENDHFDDALVISSLPFSDVKFTEGAGVEPDEPQPCGEIGSTVWYRFTPQTITTVEVNTTGSGFDTVLAVYTGDAIDQLAVLDCIDDSGGTLQSQVVFEASAGSTYWIQAGGFAGQPGELRVQASSGEA
jgi:predicted esterase